MAGPMVSTFDIQEAIKAGKTPRQIERELGVGRRRAIRVRDEMASNLMIPEAPPPGFQTISIAQDGKGKVISTRSVPTPDEEDHVEAVPEGFELKQISTYTSVGGKVGQWRIAKQVSGTGHTDFCAAVAADMKQYQDEWMRDPRGVAFEGYPRSGLVLPNYCNFYTWGDPHLGMLAHARETGSNFDLKIATSELELSADLLVSKAPPAERAVFVEVGDLWHAEDDDQRTPQGKHKLDVDGRASKVLEAGLGVTRRMILRLLEKHETVTVVLVPGNHDPKLSRYTKIWLAAVFESHPRVTILDNASPFIYWQFGSNAFVWNHGDKRFKPKDFGDLMLADRPEMAGSCRHRRAFTGHIHSKLVEEHRWGRWESFNSLCAPDMWTHSEGYRSERLVECITFHTKYGEDSRCRVTHQELVDVKAARA